MGSVPPRLDRRSLLRREVPRDVSDGLSILVCSNHFSDVRAALDDPRFDGIRVAAFPACRGGTLSADDGPESWSDDDSTIVLAGSCAPEEAGGIGQNGHCLNWYHDGEALARHLRAGAFLLTPGWLASWRAGLDAWGLDRETARRLFSESCSRLLLLDTGTEERSADRLEELATFLDRPADVLEVGLGHLRLFLENRALGHRVAEQQRERAAANRRAADHAMALEMVAALADLGEEDDVVANVSALFTTLFGAERTVYLAHDGSEEGRTFVGGVSGPAEAETAARLRSLTEPWVWTDSGNGFRLAVTHGGDRIGTLEVDGLTFPEYREAYLDAALRIAGVCALAISNARRYSEIRRAEETIRVTAGDLARSNEELERFASVASHDLQEPLRKIMAFGSRLASRSGDRLDDRGRDYLDRMMSASGRMRTLIEDLLAYSRLRGRDERRDSVDLGEIVGEVVGDLEARIGDSGGRVDVGDLPTVEADPTRMRQLFQNLIGNALKFARPGVPPLVTVRMAPVDGERPAEVRADGELCRVLIEDNGIGFEQKHAEKIFGVFQRLHARSEYEGTGIGLALCRRIVDGHGGRLAARSVPGEGTTFDIILPLRAMTTGPPPPHSM